MLAQQTLAVDKAAADKVAADALAAQLTRWQEAVKTMAKAQQTVDSPSASAADKAAAGVFDGQFETGHYAR